MIDGMDRMMPNAGLRRPPVLRPGDRVAVIAPAGPVDLERLEDGLAWLRRVGFEVVEGRSLREPGCEELEFMAANDDARRADLLWALTSSEIAAVISARGGDGTPRLLDGLPWADLATLEPKVVAGLSDITALHQALAARLGWASLWSPMPATPVLTGDTADPWSRDGLAAALFGDDPQPLVLAGSPVVAGPVVTAPLVGGTISLLSAMVGTPHAFPGRGAIAVLEDIGEEAYRLERFLTHLRRSGFFDGVVGIAVGDLIDCTPPAQVQAVVRDRLGGLDVPVVGDLTFGHGPRQASLWLGRPATLDAGAGTLTQSRSV